MTEWLEVRGPLGHACKIADWCASHQLEFLTLLHYICYI